MIFQLVMLISLIRGHSSHVPLCACASTDTEVFTENREYVYHLEAPNCLRLLEQDGYDLSSGVINVIFENRSAFVKPDRVYVRNCNESFGCICTTQDSTVYSDPEWGSPPLSTLTSDTCSRIKGQIQICDGDTWVPLETDSGNGWIKKDSVQLYPSCQTTSGCPRIISRNEWGAREVLEVTRMNEAPHYAIIHHTAGSSCNSRERCVEILQYIQQLHMTRLGWSDIGYNFVIGEDGVVYEGRGWDVQGAHTSSCNQHSLGIAVFGNFENRRPNSAALNALRSLLACAVRMGHLDPDYKLFGRRDWNRKPSSSPGSELNNVIRTWSHYNRTDICV